MLCSWEASVRRVAGEEVKESTKGSRTILNGRKFGV